MAGFHKGWSGSPFHTGYNANKGMDTGDAEEGDDGPRIGPGYLGKKVTMEVSKASKGRKDDD
jgi:hypothetical protein